MNEYDPTVGDAPLEDVVEPRAKWPAVVGWFSVSLGSLGVLKNACGAVMYLAMGGRSPFGMGQTAEQRAAIEKAVSGLGGVVVGMGLVSVVSLAVSVVLLVAGVQLLKRKRSSVGLHVGWALVRIVVGLVECGLAYVYQSATMKAAVESMPRQRGGPSAEQMATCMNVSAACGVGFGLLLVLAYPVVVLIVLNRPWAKREIARWGGASA